MRAEIVGPVLRLQHLAFLEEDTRGVLGITAAVEPDVGIHVGQRLARLLQPFAELRRVAEGGLRLCLAREALGEILVVLRGGFVERELRTQVLDLGKHFLAGRGFAGQEAGEVEAALGKPADAHRRDHRARSRHRHHLHAGSYGLADEQRPGIADGRRTRVGHQRQRRALAQPLDDRFDPCGLVERW